ncbi:MAG TPA: M20/M25/M40 family metallo-hydrolase [Pyrinomonadaceae bacterium]|nr:M20/M25/M40 family metallo-hydrolase [Pyrinomonadaceae bacterium]
MRFPSAKPGGLLPSFLGLFLICTITVTSTFSQTQPPAEKTDLDVINRIKSEELQHSQVMETVGYLTDVIGPRLTGSPGLRRAQQYAIERLREWGIANGQREPWGQPFGRGWSLEGFTANVTAPAFSSLIAYPKAWSPGTTGLVRSEAVFFDVGTDADLARYKGKLKGKIVLFSPPRPVEASFLPQPKRASDEELRQLSEAKFQTERPNLQLAADRRARAELNYKKWQLLIDEGAAAVLEPGAGDAGTVYVTGATVPSLPDVPADQRRRPWDLNAPKILPQVVVAAEQYNRIIRQLTRGVSVQLEISIEARFYDQDLMGYNVIAEIPGSDLKDEVVMIGGCLDSWHTGTGATDNAAGAAVALEVLRLFKVLNLKPRRTVRIGLWSAEEQGAFGSQAYVAKHFAQRIGTADERPARFDFKPEHETFSGYFNLDYGTGRIRGVYLQGNENVRPIFSAWLGPFRDMGAATLTSAGIYATDHNSFDAVGLPGFQFIRDFMENNPRTAHTNMDVYEHVLSDDLKQSAVIAAAFIYQASMRDEKLPRKRNQ